MFKELNVTYNLPIYLLCEFKTFFNSFSYLCDRTHAHSIWESPMTFSSTFFLRVDDDNDELKKATSDRNFSCKGN